METDLQEHSSQQKEPTLTSPVKQCHVFTARRNEGSIVFSIIAKFFLCFSVYTITHESLYLAWWNFAQTRTSTTSRKILHFKVISQRSRSHGFLCYSCARYCDYLPMHEHVPWQPLEPYSISRSKVRNWGHMVFVCFFVCMILLELVGLDSQNVAQAWLEGST